MSCLASESVLVYVLLFLLVAFEEQTAAGKEKGLALEKHYVSELRKLGVS